MNYLESLPFIITRVLKPCLSMIEVEAIMSLLIIYLIFVSSYNSS